MVEKHEAALFCSAEIRFPGNVRGPAVLTEALSQTNILIPSLHEGLTLSVLEAQRLSRRHRRLGSSHPPRYAEGSAARTGHQAASASTRITRALPHVLNAARKVTGHRLKHPPALDAAMTAPRADHASSSYTIGGEGAR